MIFGRAGIGDNGGGLFELSSVNGANGFKLIGERAGDLAGASVAGLGDVNRDGYDDLIVGAFFANSSTITTTGAAYMIRGGLTIGSSGSILLSDLNGNNGFKLEGEKHGDGCGYSVSGLGDINSDGYLDIVIAAASASPNGISSSGRSYVVLGGAGLGNTGLISLAALNGVNGFKLDGESPGDYSGNSVGALGDINGDGMDDFVIGADTTLINLGQPPVGGPGTSYVVFGSWQIGAGGLIPLSRLNGTQGFKIKGEGSTDNSGVSVRSAGDINGDGYPDLLIGAWKASPGNRTAAGCSYVLFGARNFGQTGLVSLSSLNGANGFKLAGELANDHSGISVSGIRDTNGDGVDDLIIGASSTGGGFGTSYVVFGDMLPLLINNELIVNQNETVLLNTSHLLTIDANHNSDQLFFIISDLNHGQFLLTNNSNQPVTIFSQQQVIDGQIVFQHDGGTVAPTYKTAVNTTGLAFIPPQPASIDFDTNPLLVNNTLWISQGDTLLLSSEQLSAVHPGAEDSLLQFAITGLQHGRFTVVGSPSLEISRFYQQNITDRRIQFSHDNSTHPPIYTVSATDGRVSSPPATVQVIFNPPVLVR